MAARERAFKGTLRPSCRCAFRRLGLFRLRCLPSGPARPGAFRREFVSALFARSRRLVRGSQGVVAFVFGRSAGSWFTCQFAACLGLPVVVFPVEGPGALRSLGSGRWVPLRCWAGAFRWVPEKKGGLS